MNPKILLVLFALVLFSCNEKFKTIDPSGFNSQIEERNDIKSPEELITIYYNYPKNEGDPDLKISSKARANNTWEIVLIHDRLQDDSQRAIKIIMLAKRTNNIWEVEEIKKNWKCWDGRGHTDWGIEFCN